MPRIDKQRSCLEVGFMQKRKSRCGYNWKFKRSFDKQLTQLGSEYFESFWEVK